jgi:hypothetical protein
LRWAFGLLGVVALLAGGMFPAAASAAPRTHSASRIHAASRPTGGSGWSSVPAAARAPISAALGADEPAYHVHAGVGGFAASQGGGVGVRFGRAGVSVSASGATLGLGLVALGRGASLTAVPSVSPKAAANRVSYAYPGVAEWFANGPLGLEQGFTVERPPAAGTGGPLTLSMSVSGGLRASLAGDGHAAAFSRVGWTVLSYTGLAVTDARGRSVSSWLGLDGNHLLIRVDDFRAAYPLQIDPYIQAAKLTASFGAGGLVGASVALSDNTVAVGVPDATVGSNEAQGAVLVFTEPSGGWGDETQTAILYASDGTAFDALGESVAISGNTIVAGAPYGPNFTKEGAVYVFTEPSGGWSSETQTAKLTASDAATDDLLGQSVAISSGGATIAAGASYDTVNGHTGQGAVYVFSEPSGGWSSETQAAKLTASDGATDDGLGASVAISAGTVVAGALEHEVDGHSEQGAVYVFTEPSGGWANETQAAQLTASDGATDDLLGQSVAIAPGGATIAAGAYGRNGGEGAVYVFTEPSGGWSNEMQTAELTASDGAADDYLGYSVAMSSDGTTVAAGAVNAGSSGGGAVYVFDEPSGGWANKDQAAELTASDGSSGNDLGDSVAMSGSTIVGGAPRDDSAYVFEAVDPTSTTVACSPSSVSLGQQTACVATVMDTSSSPTTPTGSVSFASSGSGGFSSGSCVLSGSGASASCGVTYSQDSVGSPSITASYGGDETHTPSSNSTSVGVALDPTSTSVSCSPNPVEADQWTTCTATVTDTSATPTTPSGQVGWSANGESGVDCTLSGSGSSASCDVGYEFSTNAEETIDASYGGDSTHAASSGSTVLNGGYPTVVVLSCGSPDAVNEADECVAQIFDTSGDTLSGTVSFSSSGYGTFSSAGLGVPCTVQGFQGGGICVINYTPLASGSPTITATYNGDSGDQPSSGTFQVSVSAASTSTSVSCVPNPVEAYAYTACTATVTDTSSYPSTPTGQVAWTSDGFPTISCNLAGSGSSADCTVYAAYGSAGSPSIGASYGGDAAHSSSSGSPSLTVVGDPTSTVVACSPNPVATNKATSCTATVTDTSVSGQTPSGTVSFTTSGGGSFSPGGSCTLAGSGSQSSCAVSYTQTSAGQATIAATYSGDNANAISSGSTPLDVAAPPTLSGVSPDVGPATGGTAVTITGTNFAPTTTVRFGAAASANVTVVSTTELTATAPKHKPGSVTVTVTTAGGTSRSTPRDLFAYGPPTVKSFTPTSGVTGSTTTLTGTGFAKGLTVFFGTLASPRVTVLSGTKLKAVVPDGAVKAALTVADTQGSATSTSTFTPTLSVTGFTPSRGPVGTVVTIKGIGFTATSTVTFAGVTATDVIYLSSTKLKATVPTKAKTGPIKVTNTTTPKDTAQSAATYTIT